MAPQTYVHVVKKNVVVAEHAVIPVEESVLPPLQDGFVRLRSSIISLTYNNLTYDRMGSIRNWWDASTVPEQLPSPYSDRSQYGIAPCWGYGEVLESRISGIEAGMVIWGYWPLSGLPVDYKLVKGDASGHWIEISEQRKTLMPFYNRYIIRNPGLRLQDIGEKKLNEMGAAGVHTVWECGYLLNQYNFKEPYIHPAGHEGTASQPWNEVRGDLSSAVIINLSAGGRTARSFIDFAVNERDPETGPLGMLSITAHPAGSEVAKSPFPYKAVAYDAATGQETVGWLAGLNPTKIVICDFGGRGSSLFDLLRSLKEHLTGVELLVVGIDVEPIASTHDETVQKLKERAALPERVQMNTGPIRDTLIAQRGEPSYFEEAGAAWDRFVGRGCLESLKLIWGGGVEGEKGIEGGWDAICNGTLASDAAFAYKM